MANKKKLVCVVPVYNEEDVISETIRGLKKIGLIDEIIIINDGSEDKTLEITKGLDVTVIDLERNYGKGYAIKEAIRSLEYDYFALVDGDLGETSREVEELILPIINKEADVTIAKFPARSTATNSKGGFGIVMSLAKKGVYFFTKKEIDSSLSGQRVYTKEVLDKISYIPNGFGIEVAMTIQSINAGFHILEVPVTMRHRFSQRDLKGIIHRGKQFRDVLRTFIILFFRR